ncbi:hypothetical protein ACJ2A9_18120 [Anaerobacillus sp. MEB173]|uniref:hypothetical protein n=1 Tax=Anaerobacillus sp. MEB173 TaxID=3383345 RepID=UPI003F93BFB6
MTYYARNPILMPVILLLIISTTGWYSPFSSWLFNFVGFIFTLVLALSIFINYELQINDHELVYTIYLYSHRIYQKKITPKEIDILKLRKFGWTSKGATIRLQQGKNIRLSNFMPTTFDDELLHFANKHSIETWKNKDYELVKQFEK